MKLIFSFVLCCWNLSHLLLILKVTAEDSSVETTDTEWLNPSDMFYYDEVNKAMINEKIPEFDVKHETTTPGEVNSEESRLNNDPSTNNISAAKENSSFSTAEFLAVRRKLDECQLERNSFHLKHDEMPFMKRFLQKLLRLFPDEISENQDQDIYLHLKLSHENRKVLYKLVNFPGGHLTTADEVLSHIFDVSSILSNNDAMIFSYFTSEIRQMFVIGLCVVVVSYLIMKISFVKILIITFVISVIWHWQHMYKDAVAKQHAELLKYENLPLECKPSKMTWVDSIQYWFHNQISTGEDKCVAYHKHLLVDPFWDVSPALAVSDTITSFFLHPLGLIGTELGLFFRNLHQNLPLFAFWIIVPLLCIMFLLMVLIVSGYDFKLLYGAVAMTRPSTVEHQTSFIDRPKIQEIMPKTNLKKNSEGRLVSNTVNDDEELSEENSQSDKNSKLKSIALSEDCESCNIKNTK